MNAEDIIKRLDLKPLPMEGGYYRETYRSAITLPGEHVGLVASESRSASTAIYYLITLSEFSVLHRIKYDEIFHFYVGDPIEMIQFDDQAIPRTTILGSNLMANQEVQVVVPANVWQGLRLKAGGRFALLGTTVAPGFDFRDFEVGARGDLIRQFPNLRKEIELYTRT